MRGVQEQSCHLVTGDTARQEAGSRSGADAQRADRLVVVLSPGAGRGVLDEGDDAGDDAGGHEPGRADGGTAAGDLGDLDQSAPVRHVDPATGAGRLDLVGAGVAAGVDDDLDLVTLQGVLLRTVAGPLWAGRGGGWRRPDAPVGTVVARSDGFGARGSAGRRQ